MIKEEKEVNNINKLLKSLKFRLNSHGKTKSTDQLGNTLYVKADIFSKESLIDFLYLSLSEFNMVPKFTLFSFEDDKFVQTFSSILVEGAMVTALAAKALTERGREFKYIQSDGLTVEPPSVSDMLQTQYSIMLSDHFEKLKLIKSAIHTFEE